MCGISGLMRREPAAGEELRQAAAKMNACLRHRGPDMTGQWLEPGGRGALAFSRLSIQDLSPAANQPMHSESGRYVIVYNGEVYNTDELRELIGRPAHTFRTHSDTEVLLACIEKLGLEQTLKRANAMLALALWDRQSNSLFLARDRMGKKPLHYAITKEEACFASEIQALLHRPLSRCLDAEAIQAYFGLTYIPAPLTVWQAVRKVRAGHILEIRPDLSVRETPYWTLADVASARKRGSVRDPELQEQVAALIKDAVRRRLISDVPVGVLMSGGVDSSLVAYTVARVLGVPLETFTIGLEDKTIDESLGAQAIAAKIGVNNTSLVLSRADALKLVDEVVDLIAEPFGDYSMIPTHAVCRLARPKATVLLSGDGGDEVFGGYTRYTWSTGPRALAGHLYARYRRRRPSLSSREIALELYRRLMTRGTMGGSMEPDMLDRLAGGLGSLPALSVLPYLRYIDFQIYLPDDILVKADRMSMANGIELRCPFLDYRIVEFSWGLPDRALVAGSTRKVLTRRLFVDALGEELLQSRKYGFGLPIGEWLAGPLRPQVEAAVEALTRRSDIPISQQQIRGWWTALLGGDRSFAHSVWLVYAFWRWAERWKA